MHRLFKKDQILTVPNLLSTVRLLLIPVIVWLYLFRHDYGFAAAVILLSGATDIADGIIARKFHKVSDLGKVLDPIADKLTQGIIIICLTVRYRQMIFLVILFALKELCMGIFGWLSLKWKDSVNSARWHGKLNTVVLYAVLLALILFPTMPLWLVNLLILVNVSMMLLSLVLYALFYRNILKTPTEDGEGRAAPSAPGHNNKEGCPAAAAPAAAEKIGTAPITATAEERDGRI